MYYAVIRLDMPTVQVRFAPPLHERLIQECERLEITPSEFIRKLADAALNQMEEDRPAKPPSDDLGHHGPKDRDRQLKRLPPQVRGFAALGGDPIVSKTDRLKTK